MNVNELKERIQNLIINKPLFVNISNLKQPDLPDSWQVFFIIFAWMENVAFFSKLALKGSYFDQRSSLHGIGHTYRVMVHAHELSITLNRSDLLYPVLAAAFVHDMARKHDGFCCHHGLWAVERKVPLFKAFFMDHGVCDNDLALLSIAVENHSRPEELERNNPAYVATAILKDADALDRIRLGENNLDQRYLRFKESKGLVGFARSLYLSSHKEKFHNFTEVLSHAHLINQNKNPW